MPSFATRKLKLSSFLSATLIVFALCAGAAASQQELVESIVVIGNRRIPAETVRSRIYTHPGDVYDQAALERDFSSLWNTGYFEDLRFEREQGKKGWIINVYVKEKPTIRTIDYKGLNSASNSDVLERFKKDKVGLSVESQYDPTKVKKAEVVLKNILAEHGHQFATIRTEIRPIPPAAVALAFVIKEGPKVKVGKISFEGNKKLKKRELRAAMKNLKPIGIPHSIFLENLFARTYDASKLQEDTERVREAYQKKGYFKALIGDPVTNLHDAPSGFLLNPVKKKNGKAIDIKIPIEEGDQYRLASITFKNGKVGINPKALRGLFAMKDGDIFSTELVRKGLDNLRKAYGELGYINFTGVPDTQINEEKKLISLDIDLDEGKSYSVRRIEFTGNTTTRDKVIRRELALEEGNVYNSQRWELSLQRLNQLQYFEPLKPEESAEIKRNDKDATVDINLKVKEKGKNSIGLTGGVSGLAGSFIGLNYETNNFLGVGETLRVEANVGSLERTLLFSFTEPYFADRPLQLGFSVFTTRYSYNQAQQASIQINQQLNLPQSVLDTLQNFNQSRTGFTTSLSYPLHRSFKRVGITYSFDTSSVTTFSNASSQLFEQVAFRNVSGPDALKGVLTSKIVPSFSYNTIFNPQTPHSGKSLFIATELSGLGGNVAAIRPIVEFKHFIPVGTHTIGYRVQGSFITGYRGLDANPAERFFSGGDLDLRGFDTRTLSPYAFLADSVDLPLTNPDGTTVPKDPTNPRAGNVTVHLPIHRIIIPGGDTNLIGNLEYRFHVAGPVTLAAFGDFGLDFIARSSQLRLNTDQFNALNTTPFGCATLVAGSCQGAIPLTFGPNLTTVGGTNFVPRASTGLELQVILPIVNAPFRIYYAYNPLRLDTIQNSPSLITRSMFPVGGAGDFTYRQALQAFEPSYQLREPRKTFRFTVATTF